MTTLPDKTALLGQIASLLPLALDPAYISKAATDDIYEAVSFCLIAKAAEDAEGKVSFVDGDGKPVTSLCFSTQPHRVSKGPYTHALIEFDGKLRLEAHIGIYISSKTLDIMECDVCVVQKREADFFRKYTKQSVRNRGEREAPDSSKVLIATECKYWENDLNSLVSYACIGRFKSLSAKHHHIVTAIRSRRAERKIRDGLGCYVWQPALLPTNAAPIMRFQGVLIQEFTDYRTESRNNQ